MKSLRVGVVGLGRMGLLHVQTLTRMPGWEVVELADRNREHRERASSEGFRVVASSEELVPLVDVAVVATSTDEHIASTLPLLRQEVPCLVEKPLALDREGASMLFEVAGRRGTLLTVGQCERFNAGVLAATDEIRRDPGPVSLRVNRMAPWNAERPPTSDVVTDLLIHDLDWVVNAFGEEPTRVEAIDARWRSDELREITCELTWSGDRRARLSASQIADRRKRDATVHGSGGSVATISLEHPSSGKDPLTLQAEALHAAVGGSRDAVVSAHDVLAVMTLTDQILAACSNGIADAQVHP